MMKFLQKLKAPSAHDLARRQLESAKRDLLLAEAHREHATLLAQYQRGLIVRLTRMLETGELV